MTISANNQSSFSQQPPKYLPPQLQAFSNHLQPEINFQKPSNLNQNQTAPFQNYFSPGLWTDTTKTSSSFFPFGVQSNYSLPEVQPQVQPQV